MNEKNNYHKTWHTNIRQKLLVPIYLALSYFLFTGWIGAESSDSSFITKEDSLVEVQLTGNDQMQFNLNEFEVTTGDTIKIHMTNIGKLPAQAMSHNVIFLKEQVDPIGFTTTAIQAKDNDYFPESMAEDVIAHTRLLGPGESDIIEFSAPKPGSYDFLCSFPAHYQTGMKGVMTVKN